MGVGAPLVLTLMSTNMNCSSVFSFLQSNLAPPSSSSAVETSEAETAAQETRVGETEGTGFALGVVRQCVCVFVYACMCVWSAALMSITKILSFKSEHAVQHALMIPASRDHLYAFKDHSIMSNGSTPPYKRPLFVGPDVVV